MSKLLHFAVLVTAAALLACSNLGANPRSHKYADACGNARPESNV